MTSRLILLVIVLAATGCALEESGEAERFADETAAEVPGPNGDPGSTNDGAGGSDGSAGAGAGTPVTTGSGSGSSSSSGSGGSGGADVCDDEHDTPGTEHAATDLGFGIDDCGDFSQPANFDSVSGIISDADDVDYYKLSASDPWNFCDPNLSGAVALGSDLEFCMFMECPSNSSTNFSCTDGTPTTSPDGRKGCCRVGTGSLASSNITCEFGIFADTEIYIRVTPMVQQLECKPYLMDFHY